MKTLTRFQTLLMAFLTSQLSPAEESSDERGDVPGWVMITLMSAVLVAGLMALAGPALQTMFNDAMSRVR